MRLLDRQPDQMREVLLDLNVAKHAEGSCLIKFGDTHVLCTASIEEKVPPWLRETGEGWITAEYGMLPRSTHTRGSRESVTGKQSGRTLEIQRLIGRSLRSVVDRKKMGELQIRIDCDVIQADGGTRTASITGAYVALYQAFLNCINSGKIKSWPIFTEVSAVSCGLLNGTVLLDLDYLEDSSAEVDANFVLTGSGQIVEIQATAEKNTFTDKQFFSLLHLAKKGTSKLFEIQRDIINTL